MKFNNTENECVELSDGRKIWLSRSMAVVCIFMAKLTSDNSTHILMVKRGPGCPDEVGKWVLPCGYLDWNESLAEAGMRETYEETGLDVTKLGGFTLRDDFVNGQPWWVRSTPNENRQNVSSYFGKTIRYETIDDLPKIDQNALNPQETASCEWVDMQSVISLERMGLIGFGHADIIQRYTTY